MNTVAKNAIDYTRELQGAVYMQGEIYTRQKCPACGGSMKHDHKRRNCFCRLCGMPASKGYFVVYGREIHKRFGGSYLAAERFLNGIRYERAKGTFDVRDYQADNPLGFENQARKWLEYKRQVMKPQSFKNVRLYIEKSCAAWGQRNVKAIHYGEIEDFLFAPETARSDKTRANIRSCLHDFFTWLSRREGVPMPELPACRFELKWRKYTDWQTQSKIIAKLREISSNSMVPFGVELLSSYAELRPDDLRRITVGDIDTQNGIITIKNPTKRKNKMKVIRLLPEHVAEIAGKMAECPALPAMPFFRHQDGTPFGPKYFYVWWKRACAELGIEGLDLYGGTRHTTTTMLAMTAGKEVAKQATGHDTNKAFERYCQAMDDSAFKAAQIVYRERYGEAVEIKERKV